MNRLSSAFICATLPTLALFYFLVTTNVIPNASEALSIDLSEFILAGLAWFCKIGIAFSIGAVMAFVAREAFDLERKMSSGLMIWSAAFLLIAFIQFDVLLPLSTAIVVMLAYFTAGIVDMLMLGVAGLWKKNKNYDNSEQISKEEPPLESEAEKNEGDELESAEEAVKVSTNSDLVRGAVFTLIVSVISLSFFSFYGHIQQLSDFEDIAASYSEMGEVERRDIDRKLVKFLPEETLINPVYGEFKKWMFYEAATSENAVISGDEMTIMYNDRYGVICRRDAGESDSLMLGSLSMTGSALAARVCALRAGEF